MLTESELAEVLAALRHARNLEVTRLRVIRSWLRGEVDDIYRPEGNSREYQALVERSKFNLLRLVVTTVAQNLFVDGFRPTVETGAGREVMSSADSELWGVWQANRMDSRQAHIYRPAVTYGAAYVSVLPGDPHPVMQPMSPWRCTALYEDVLNDEWPVYALTSTVDEPFETVDAHLSKVLGPTKVKVWDESHVYTMAGSAATGWGVVAAEEHGLGVCPIVRFHKVDDDGSASFGKVEPLIPLQQQINQTTFSLMMAQHFGAFKQRWATGVEAEEDADGNVLSPWLSRIDAVWTNESTDAGFGEFSETDLRQYLDSRDKSILGMSSMGQVPPHNLLVGNGISNIAAETLAALESAHRHDIGDHQTSFGESAEQVIRLAGLASGDEAAWEDTSAQVVWRDTTPRSLGQLIDAFVKMAAGLGVPVEALWERIPGVTDQDIAYWKSLAESGGLMADLEALMQEDAGAVTAGAGVDGQAPPPVGDPGQPGVPQSAAAAAFG